jgi:hypothetical protein
VAGTKVVIADCTHTVATFQTATAA